MLVCVFYRNVMEIRTKGTTEQKEDIWENKD
jgi:hypothetical protein